MSGGIGNLGQQETMIVPVREARRQGSWLSQKVVLPPSTTRVPEFSVLVIQQLREANAPVRWAVGARNNN